MRTKFAGSIAVVSALLATVAVPAALQNRSAVRPEASRTVESQMLAQSSLGAKRPLIARAEELTDKESA